MFVLSWFMESPLLSSGLSFRVVYFIDTSPTSSTHAAAIERPTPTQCCPNCSSGSTGSRGSISKGFLSSDSLYLWVRAIHHVGAVEGGHTERDKGLAHFTSQNEQI